MSRFSAAPGPGPCGGRLSVGYREGRGGRNSGVTEHPRLVFILRIILYFILRIILIKENICKPHVVYVAVAIEIAAEVDFVTFEFCWVQEKETITAYVH